MTTEKAGVYTHCAVVKAGFYTHLIFRPAWFGSRVTHSVCLSCRCCTNWDDEKAVKIRDVAPDFINTKCWFIQESFPGGIDVSPRSSSPLTRTLVSAELSFPGVWCSYGLFVDRVELFLLKLLHEQNGYGEKKTRRTKWVHVLNSVSAQIAVRTLILRFI